ncbi:MAG: DUF6544 family protein [Salibacteraceae bacterium]
MKALFLILVMLHGLVHSLGFIKAFEISEVKELATPISKPIGLLWLITTVLFLTYGVLYYFNKDNAWLVGITALIFSQTLIVFFWSDAKFGTIPNVIILLAVICSIGNALFNSTVEKEKQELLQKSSIESAEILSIDDIEGLPLPVKKWLLSSGAVGKVKTLNGKITQSARMKLNREQKEWYNAKATQYTMIDEPSFHWTLHLSMNELMWFKGRDKFQNGKGEMLIKINSLINVVNESGEKIDEGSIQRYLGEMVWFPSLAVSPYIRWEQIDDLSAKATMSYKNTKGGGTFYFNEQGDFTKFIAMRFQGNEPNAERKEWVLTVDGYRVFEGIKVPSRMEATWQLEEGSWTWLQLEIEEIIYNITPE